MRFPPLHQAGGVRVRRAGERTVSDKPWLRSRHGLASGGYERDWPRFRSLLVVNEDTLAPGGAFSPHPHWDLEILTWVTAGVLEHTDTLGHRASVHPGELQHVRAGSGIEHAEGNVGAAPLELWQIWLEPRERGLAPAYAQAAFPAEARAGRLQLLASQGGEAGALPIALDARVFALDLADGHPPVEVALGERHAWVQVLGGAARLVPEGGPPVDLGAGDAAALSDTPGFALVGQGSLLVFDLA